MFTYMRLGKENDKLVGKGLVMVVEGGWGLGSTGNQYNSDSSITHRML